MAMAVLPVLLLLAREGIKKGESYRVVMFLRHHKLANTYGVIQPQ